MAITLPYTFTSGGIRSGSEVNENLETVRKWLNGNIASSDMNDECVHYWHILKPEHYGSPLKCTLGTTHDIYGRRASMDKAQRAIFSQKISGTDYVAVPELSATVTVDQTALVKVSARFYFWASYETAGGTYASAVVGYAKLFIAGTSKGSTTRRLVMHDGPAGYTLSYDKNEVSMVYSEVMSAGTYDVSVGIRVLPNTGLVNLVNDGVPAGGGSYNLVFAETRSFVVKVAYQ